MYLIIRTDFGADIEATLIKVENGIVFYKINHNLRPENWKSIPAQDVKMLSIKDHRSEHPGRF